MWQHGRKIIILSKSERETQIPHSISCRWNLKYDINYLTYKTETDLTNIEDRLVVAKGEGE